MANLSFVQVAADSTGKRLRTTIVEDASTVHQEVMNLAGSTGDFIEPFSDVPSSSALALAVRTVMGATGTVMGSVALLAGTTANSIGSVAVVEGSSLVDHGVILLSTAFGTAAIDPRQSTIVGGTSGAGLGTIVSTGAGGAAIDPRQSTIIGATSGAGLGTILSTGAGGAAIDPRLVTIMSSSGINVGASSASPSSGGMGLFVRNVMGATGTVIGSVALLGGTTANSVGSVALLGGTTANSVGSVALLAGTTANTIGTVNISSQSGGSTLLDTTNEAWRVNVVAGGAGGGVAQLQVRSTANAWTDVGYVAASNLIIPVGITTAANSTVIIDPRAASLTASSSQTFPIQLSTAPNTAYIDPRIVTPSSQWTVTAALAAASTLSAAPTSQWTVSIAGTASSAVLGSVLVTTGLTGAAIDPRQVTIVAGTSGAYISVLNATAQGAATIDPRQATIVGGTSGAGIGVIISTAVGAAAIDPRVAYGDVSSGSTVGVQPLGLGGRAATTNPTTVADGGRTWLMTDAVGRQVTVASQVRNLTISTGVTVTTTSETSILAAAGSSVYHDLTFLSITNRSTANVVRVVLSASSGSGSSGYNFTLAERGGIVMPFNPPLYQQTANSAWCITIVSGASTVDVSVQAVKNVPS